MFWRVKVGQKDHNGTDYNILRFSPFNAALPRVGLALVGVAETRLPDSLTESGRIRCNR